jgi:hypothetical protein
MLRFLAGFDIQNDIVIFRDADSRLMKRDYYLVEDWLNNSDKDVHIIRDHPANKSRILAGLWGVRNKLLATPEHIIKFWEFYQAPDTEKWSLDQFYLNKYIYPLVKTQREFMLNSITMKLGRPMFRDTLFQMEKR